MDIRANEVEQRAARQYCLDQRNDPDETVQTIAGGQMVQCVRWAAIVLEMRAWRGLRLAVEDAYGPRPEPRATDKPIGPGDTVRIKSGGNLMTVAHVENGIATCLFHKQQTNEPTTLPMPVVTLRLVDAD